MKKVFLGGTCNESQWRKQFIEYLTINYFDPVVDDWDEKAQTQEIYERKNCDYCLYCITPRMTGVYSIAEVIDDSNKRPNSTILVLQRFDEAQRFDPGQWKSLQRVAALVKENGGMVFNELALAAEYMNTH